MQHGITENVEHEGLLAAVQQALTTGETPDAGGHYGSFGGRFVPETLFPALVELEAAFREAVEDPAFHRELAGLLAAYVGRPTPVTEARRLSQAVGGARILLKREDLNHTGAHKINNALGQALLAKRMGKERITAETGAGQHGVATATAAALLGLECDVFMGARDMARQELNVFRMRLLGARVIPVEHGTATLKEAVNEAIRDWVARVRETHYCIGSAVGPHPYPWIVQRFQAIIGVEARRQVLQLTGRLPDAVVACVGGGSNAIGIFSGFLDDGEVALVGVEAGGAVSSRGRTRPAWWRGGRASSTVAGATSSRMRTARSRRPTPSPPASTTPGWGLNTPGRRSKAGPSTWPSVTPRPWKPSGPWPAWKESCPPWRARTPSPTPPGWPPP